MRLLPRVRAVSLFNYIEIAASVGLDPYLLLRDAQIDPALLAHPENWLGARPVGDLLERSARTRTVTILRCCWLSAARSPALAQSASY